ncbi:MAG: hypothetical protein OHK0028_19050 [Deltaproteobacteria bacterium]
MIINIIGLDLWLGKIRNLPKQLRYATAVTLTRSAEHAQDAILARTRDVFTIRRNWLTPGYKFGINRKAATKDDLSAEVFSRAPWMLRHEEGGLKLPKKEYLAVPQEGVKRTKKDLIPAGQRPKALKRSFVIWKTRSGPMLFQRTGRGKSSTIKPMYAFEKSVHIEARWRFVKTGMAVVKKVYGKIFSAALKDALETARR